MVLLSFAFVLPSSWWLSGLEAALFIHIRLLRAHKVVLKNPSTEQLIGVRCKRPGPFQSFPSCAVVNRRAITREMSAGKIWVVKNPPCLGPSYFVLQDTMHSKPQVLQDHYKNSFLFILSSFFISDEVVIAEDHHSETHRTHNQSFFQSNYPNSSWDKPHQRPKLIMHLAVLLGSWSRKINMA